MRISEIEVENFMAGGTARLDLPERGVVVLVGPNGAGKSRFVEAVAFAAWGRTLRGTSPWRQGEPGRLLVRGSFGVVERTVTARGTRGLVVDGQRADTPAKTQEKLAPLVGDVDYWRRTHVFSSADAAHFSEASDSDRKDLIERMVDLDVFDRAWAECSAALRQAEGGVQAALREVARLDGQLAGHRRALAALAGDPPFQEEPPPEPPRAPDPGEAGLAAARADAEAAEAARVRVGDALAAVVVDPGVLARSAEALAALRAAEAKLKLLESGACPTCDAPVDADAHRAGFSEGHERARLDYQAASEAEAQERWRVAAEQHRLRGERDAAAEAARGAAARLREVERLRGDWEHHARALEQHRARQARLRAEHDAAQAPRVAERRRSELAAADLEDSLAEARAALAESEREVREVRAAGAALRGLRGHVIAGALDGVAALANVWLGRMAPGVSVRLSPCSETKDGGVSNKISMVVEGFGGGAYKAASGGERRRVDAAVLSAIAEVGGAETLFMDEVFDALDAPGRAAAAHVIGELGRTRAVVVITHQEDLAGAIPAVARYRVESGALARI